MPTRYCLFLFLTLSLLPRPITGQEMRSFTLSFDNDGFVFWDPPSRRADYYYTHGMRLEALLARTPPWVDRAVCDAAAPGPEACVLTSLSLGHQIYTPENVFSSDPPVDDHPYGGFLYAEFAGEWIETDTRTRVGLQIGVTGTPSLGQAAHQGFHRWLDKAEPTGWEHQIPFEIAFALSAHRTGIWSPLPATWPLSVAVLPRWGGTLGTLRTSGDARSSRPSGRSSRASGCRSSPAPRSACSAPTAPARAACCASWPGVDTEFQGEAWAPRGQGRLPAAGARARPGQGRARQRRGVAGDMRAARRFEEVTMKFAEVCPTTR
jgi:hypothetical protein